MNACRICWCTDNECHWCIVLTFKPCFWSQPDLCSACSALATEDGERARIRGKMALRRAQMRSGKAPGFLQLAEHGRQMLRVCARIEATERRAAG